MPGTDFRDKDTAVQFELNSEIAASLNIPLALVINGKDKSSTPSRPPSEVTWNC